MNRPGAPPGSPARDDSPVPGETGRDRPNVRRAPAASRRRPGCGGRRGRWVGRVGLILEQEVERGVVDYHSTSRRYVLNGALPADVRLALRDLVAAISEARLAAIGRESSGHGGAFMERT